MIFLKKYTLIRKGNKPTPIDFNSVKDKQTFITTIQQNSGIIYKAASLYTSNQQDKEDLVQEIIYQLWKSFDSFQQKSSRSTWIYRIAMNVSIYHFKQSKKKVFTVPVDQEILESQFSKTSEDSAKWEKIQQQIKQLNLLERGIIMLYLENKSHKEIAEIIGISESNVGTKISRIKIKLKSKISNE